MKMLRRLCSVQGAYYAITGIWPLVSIGTFQAITGPKTDLWLVRTVGVLITVIAAVLLWSASRKEEDVPPETWILALGAALALLAIDAIYVAAKVISPIYLLDAAAELGLIVLWLVALPARRREG
jgi:hypothetical protein